MKPAHASTCAAPSFQELYVEWFDVHSESISRATVEAYEYAWMKLVEPKLPCPIETGWRRLESDRLGERKGHLTLNLIALYVAGLLFLGLVLWIILAALGKTDPPLS